MWYDVQIFMRMMSNCIFPLALIFIMSDFKYKRKTVWAAYGGLTVFSIAVNMILFYAAGRQLMMQLFAVVIFVPGIILLLLLTRDGFFQLVFNFFTAINVLYFVSIISRIVAGMDEIIWLDALLKTVLYMGILYLFSRYFVRPYHFLIKNMKKGWLVISLLPFLIFAMVMYLGLYPRINNRNFPAVILLYMVLCCIYVVIYRIFKSTYDLLWQEQSRELLNAQLTMQKTQLAIQMENMEKVRILRHDMRHYAQIMGALLKEGNVEEALAVLESYETFFEKTEVKVYCHNVIMNVVLSYYIACAQAKGIEVKTKLDIPEELPVDEEALATVFSNAIENACHACEKIPEGQKKEISITFLSSPRLVFEIANTYAGEIKFDENHTPIAEEENHGYGTKSIVEFARQHGAVLNYKAEDGMFCMQILLQPGACPEPAAFL